MEQVIFECLYMVSYITQREAGMSATRAAVLLSLDKDDAESIYQEWLQS